MDSPSVLQARNVRLAKQSSARENRRAHVRKIMVAMLSRKDPNLFHMTVIRILEAAQQGKLGPRDVEEFGDTLWHLIHMSGNKAHTRDVYDWIRDSVDDTLALLSESTRQRLASWGDIVTVGRDENKTSQTGTGGPKEDSISETLP